jgi:hypothetical protein
VHGEGGIDKKLSLFDGPSCCGALFYYASQLQATVSRSRAKILIMVSVHLSE